MCTTKDHILARHLFPVINMNYNGFIIQRSNYIPATIPLIPTALPPAAAAAAPVFSSHGRKKGFLKLVFLESMIFVVEEL
jgi:hypothetical protein